MDEEVRDAILGSGEQERERSQINISDIIDVIQRDDPGAELVFGINGEGGVPLPSFNTIETAATIVLNQNNNNQLPQPTTSQSPQIQQNNNDSNTQKPNPGSTMNTNGRNGNGSNGRDVRRSPRVVITEQPAQKGLRFRYECEGRSAGSIPGANNTAENRTYPSIQIVGYRGRAIVVVSCVTKDPPYKPHPHNLVGRHCRGGGVCTVEINSESMSESFSNLGIQCVKRRDIDEALRVREEQRVDPYRTGFAHRSQPSSIDLNAVRLCFQVFLERTHDGRTSFSLPLTPVVSDTIYDKKAMSDLVICKLSKPSSSVAGGEEIILLCEKVTKEDIAVRFIEEMNGEIVWEDFADFQHSNVHKQVAIAFRTPPYRSLEIDQPVKCIIQLQKISDKTTSEGLPFEYLPLDKGRRSIYALRKGLRLKHNCEQLGTLLSSSIAIKTLTTEPAHVNGKGTNADEPAEKRASDSTNFVEITSEESEAVAADTEMGDVEMSDSNRKTTEWLRNSDFVPLTDEVSKSIDLPLSDGGSGYNVNIISATPTSDISFDEQKTVTARSDISNDDEDRTLNELLEQVAELDEIYSGYQMQRTNNPHPGKLAKKCSFDDMSFDDAATYTSLQRAFKNPFPVPVPVDEPSRLSPIDDNKYDIVEPIVNPIGPVIDISSDTRVDEEKLPPLPPKRLRKLTAENTEYNANIRDADSDSLTSSPDRPLSQIIIKRTPDQLSLKNRSPATSNPSSNTSSPQKKQGFFSRIFRRKSKSEINPNCAIEQKSTPDISREPSITNFDIGDRNRLSTRSFRLPQSPSKRGKPVGRSVSSVSGKRPHLTADIVHIPLKGLSSDSLPMRSGSGNLIPDQYASQVTLSNHLDRKTVSALQLADLPIQDGNMELIAIADAQSLKNLCEGKYGVRLDDDVDLTEAEHFALYTSIAPHATASEFDEASAFYVPVDGGEILSNEEIAKRLAGGGIID